MTKFVSICSSPIPKGNSAHLTQVMTDAAQDLGCETRIFHLAGLDIRPCIHCNGCVTRQRANRYCLIKDDAQPIFAALEAADIVLLSSPVYHMRMNAQMAALADRLRVFIFGNRVKGALKDKIGISGAVAWHRHGGLETTHLSHFYLFYNLDMLALGSHNSISPLGASLLASSAGSGAFDPKVRLGGMDDELGLASGRKLVARAVDLSRRLAATRAGDTKGD